MPNKQIIQLPNTTSKKSNSVIALQEVDSLTDKYVTKHITMGNLLHNILPKPQITVKHSTELFVHFLPFADDFWLSMNPRIFLLHKKNSKSRKKKFFVEGEGDESVTVEYFGGFHHPTHMQGVNFPNKPWFSGQTDIDYHTEFPLTILQSYVKQPLTDFDFREFYYLKATDLGGGFPMVKPVPAGPLLREDVYDYDRLRCVGRSKGHKHQRSNYFKFVLVVDNPLGPNYPPIFGPESDIIQIIPEGTNNPEVNFKILLINNTIKRNM